MAEKIYKVGSSYSDTEAPVGTAYEVIENGVTVDNGVVGRLSTRQLEAAKAEATEAADKQRARDKTRAEDKQKAAAREAAGKEAYAAADKARDRAAARLDAARDKLGSARGKLLDAIQLTNDELRHQNAIQGGAGIALGAAGVAAVTMAAVPALVVTGVAVVGGWANSALRQENEHENHAMDVAAKRGDTVGVAATAADFAEHRGGGFFDPARPFFGKLIAVAGLGTQVYDAATIAPGQIAMNMDQPGALDLGHYAHRFRVDANELKRLASEAQAAQDDYDQARKDFVSAMKSANAATMAQPTWSRAKN